MDEEDPALPDHQAVAKNQKETSFFSQRTVCPLPYPPARVCLSLLHSVFPLWPVTRPHRDKDDLTRPCKHTRHRLLNYRAALLLGPPWCNERALQLSISGYLTLQTGPHLACPSVSLLSRRPHPCDDGFCNAMSGRPS